MGLDDPVDGLGALEQQDDVTVQEGIVLQRLQFHDDVHLEGAADKTQEEKCCMFGLCCVIVPSVSGRLIKKLDTFPEQKQTYSKHDRSDNDGVRYSIATTSIGKLRPIGRAEKQLSVSQT